MAEAIIISALLPVVFEKSVELIKWRLGFVLGADVNKEVRKLKSMLWNIQEVLKDAEERQVTENALKRWLSNLKDTVYLADDLLEDLKLDVLDWKKEAREHHFIVAKLLQFCSCSRNPLLWAPRTCRKVKAIVERFNQLAEERTKFHLREGHAPLAGERRETYSCSELNEVIVQRNDDVYVIVEELIRQEHEKKVAVLPIVGMAGLGKTTLAQMVFHDPTVRNHFELFMWIPVRILEYFSAAKVGKAMIDMYGGTGFSVLGSIQLNVKKLIGAKRYLLVLDNVWNEDPQAWEDVRSLLHCGAEGSAVVVTTRSRVVSAIMKTSLSHELAPLSEDACWHLFSGKAFTPGMERDYPTLEAIGRDIIRKCGMLPQAVKALGALMRLKGPYEREWKAVLESKIWDLPLGKKGIQPALMLSYYNLPSHQKECVAFCALFPRDYDIEVGTLINLWMANDLIPTTTSDIELQGYQIFRELEQRYFFQDLKEVNRWYDGKKITTCRMHALIHELVRSVSGNECRTLDKRDEVSTSDDRTRHLFVKCEGPASASRTLRTLLFKFDKIPDATITTWMGAKYLRALSLHNTGLSEFPISLCDLRLLRYLDLSCNDIKEVPKGISRLFNLQTLDLSACGLLVGLPENMSEMSSLVYLYLQGCHSLRSMPIGLGKLRRLKMLTRYVVAKGDVQRGGIEELKDLNLHSMLELHNLKNVTNVADAHEANLGSKKNLEQLYLDWGDRSDVDQAESAITTEEQVLEALHPHLGLRRLAIHRYRGIKYPAWLTTGWNLFEIVLADCSRCEHLPQICQLHNLEVLEVGGMEAVKKIGGNEFYNGNHHELVFLRLKRLKLYGMPNLEEWSGVEPGRTTTFFPRIAEIEIIDCPKLRIVPAIPSVQSLLIRNCPVLRPADGFFGCLRSLMRLDLDLCDKMVLMLEQDDEPGGLLVYLQIKNCNEMMFSSPSLGMWKHFNSLRTLNFKSCNRIEILPLDLFQGLTSLEELSIHCCDSLVGSFRDGEEGLSFQGLIALEELDIQECTKFLCFHPNGLKHLTALKTLRICNNHKLMELPDFPDSIRLVIFDSNWKLLSLPKGLGRITSLTNLMILHLNEITSLPDEMDGYKALESLKIEDCPRLTELPLGLQQRLLSLNYLEIKECPILERQCMPGGKYCLLVSRIPVKYIGDS